MAQLGRAQTESHPGTRAQRGEPCRPGQGVQVAHPVGGPLAPSSELSGRDWGSPFQPPQPPGSPQDMMPLVNLGPQALFSCTEQSSRGLQSAIKPLWTPTTTAPYHYYNNVPARASSQCFRGASFQKPELFGPAPGGACAHVGTGPVTSQPPIVTSQGSIQLVVYDVRSSESSESSGSDMSHCCPDTSAAVPRSGPKEGVSAPGEGISEAREGAGASSGGVMGCADGEMEELEAKVALIGIQRQLSAEHCARFLQVLEMDLEERRRRAALERRSMSTQALPPHTSHYYSERRQLPQRRTVSLRAPRGNVGDTQPPAKTERSRRRTVRKRRTNSM